VLLLRLLIHLRNIFSIAVVSGIGIKRIGKFALRPLRRKSGVICPVSVSDVGSWLESRDGTRFPGQYLEAISTKRIGR